MSEMAALSIGTTQSTPSSTSPRTYAIGSKSSSLLRWEQRTSGVFDQYLVFTLGRREITKQSNIRRVTTKLSVPIVHSVAGVDTVVGYFDADVTFRVSGLATNAEIEAAMLQWENLHLQTILLESVKGDFPY